MTFKQILSRLTGVSCPVFGLQWNPTEPEITVAQRVISFLEDRRVLYNPFDWECPDHCVQSVIEIRRFLTDELGMQDRKSRIADHLCAMRAACRRFLDLVESGKRGRIHHPFHGGPASFDLFTALGELRSAFGLHIAMLAVKHGLSIEGDLEKILPPKPGKGDA